MPLIKIKKMKTRIIEYPLEKYNFTRIISNFLAVDELSEIKAESVIENSSGNKDFSLYKNMEQTQAYKRLYEKLNSEEGQEFYETFNNFIFNVIRPQYDEPIYYQEKPTHRILFKNSEGVSRFHRDSDYGHNEAEINYFIPQTLAFETNTLWIESEKGKEDYRAMNVSPGEMMRFKGVSLKHGAKKNETHKTRVSFDFRVIPFSKWPENVTDTSKWTEKDKQSNHLYKNAHQFKLCK